MRHEDLTLLGEIPEELANSDLVIVNRYCVDISKSRVHEVFHKIFGYGYEVDPLTHHGPMVVKSTENATHDGRIEFGPTGERKENVVYQRVLDSLDGAKRVINYRVCVVGSDIPMAFRNWRPIDCRFSRRVAGAEVINVEDCLSTRERAMLLSLCREMGLDFGEIELIRDRHDGRIYVIDVNKTPYSPPRAFHSLSGIRLMYKVARAFERNFLKLGPD